MLHTRQWCYYYCWWWACRQRWCCSTRVHRTCYILCHANIPHFNWPSRVLPHSLVPKFHEATERWLIRDSRNKTTELLSHPGHISGPTKGKTPFRSVQLLLTGVKNKTTVTPQRFGWTAPSFNYIHTYIQKVWKTRSWSP